MAILLTVELFNLDHQFILKFQDSCFIVEWFGVITNVVETRFSLDHVLQFMDDIPIIQIRATHPHASDHLNQIENFVP